MKMLANMKIANKLLLLMGIFFMCFLIVATYSYNTLNLVKVNGPVYAQITQGKDLVADILPPPEYVVESYLLSLLMIEENDSTVLREMIDKSKQLEKEYTDRHDYWAQNLEEGEIKTLLTRDSYEPAKEFFAVRDNEFIPAVLAGNREKASALAFGAMKQKYDEHRLAIDKIVALANEHNTGIEKEAAAIVQKRTATLVAIVVILLILVFALYVSLSRMITRSINAVAALLKDIAEGEGDLTRRLTVNTNDEVGELARWFNAFVDKLHDVISQVANSVSQIATSSQQLAATAQQMASGAEEQTEQTTQVATSMEEMSSTVQQIAKNSSTAAGKALNAGETADKGGAVVRDTVSGMGRISETVKDLQSVIAELINSSVKIGDILDVIDDVADQTNLLALNAAIEAARAGEQGRGFSVVADEVRKLAEKTTASTKEIGQMVRDIQENSIRASGSMDLNVNEVNNGVELANKAGTSLQEIVIASKAVQEMVQQIATAAEQQSAATEEISSNVESIASVSKQNASASQQTSAASQEISRLADDLQNMVRHFKLRKEAASKEGRTHVA